MTELDLYKWVRDHDPEIRWHESMLLCFIYTFQLEDFYSILDDTIFDDGGSFEIHVSNKRCVVIDLVEICDYYGIDAEKILPKDKED